MRSLFTVLLLTFVFSPLKSQSIDLSLNLTKGKEYSQVTNVNININQNINNQDVNMKLIIDGSMKYLVKDKLDNGYHIDMSYNKLSMLTQTAQSTVEYSSENKDLISSIFASIMNKPIYLHINNTGKVIDIKNVESLWEQSINQINVFSEEQKSQLKEHLLKSFDSKAIKGNIEFLTAIYPNHTINIGDNWDITTHLENEMKFIVSSKYELVAITSDYALIRGNSTIKTINTDEYIELKGMNIRYDLEGTILSEIKVDKESGWIIDAKMVQKMQGYAFIKENSQLPNGMKIKMNTTSESIVSN